MNTRNASTVDLQGMLNTMRKVESLMNLNNEGSYYLMKGQHQYALEYFAKAADELLQILQKSECFTKTQGIENSVSKQSSGTNITRRKHNEAFNVESQVPDDIFNGIFVPLPVPSFSDDDFYIYNKVIMFPTNAIDYKSVNFDAGEVRFLCGAVMFNLAVTHHWISHNLGLHLCSHEALLCYETAWTHLQLISEIGIYNKGFIQVAVAVWNNISHILYKERKFHHSQMSFKNVQELLAFHAASVFDHDIFTELSSNAFTLRHLSTCAPCA